MTVRKIEKVARIATSDKRKSVIALKDCQRNEDSKCAQLEQLRAFRSEYEAKLAVQARAGMEARQLRDYRQFLEKLSDAIVQQSREVEEAQRQTSVAREHLLGKSRRSLAMQQLVDKRRSEAQKSASRAEQKASDEGAASRAGEPVLG